MNRRTFLKTAACCLVCPSLSGAASYDEHEWLSFYDDNARGGWPAWVMHYGYARAKSILADARKEFSSILDVLPYMGEHCFLQDYIGCYMILARYLVQKGYGYSLDKIVRVHYDAAKCSLARIPWLYRLQYNRQLFTDENYDRLRACSAQLQKEEYPDSYISHFVEGDGSFTWGLDITQCVHMKLFPEFGAEEYLPYLCPPDDIRSYAFGDRMWRSGTIALGAEKCDFRHIQGIPPLGLFVLLYPVDGIVTTPAKKSFTEYR